MYPDADTHLALSGLISIIDAYTRLHISRDELEFGICVS